MAKSKMGDFEEVRRSTPRMWLLPIFLGTVGGLILFFMMIKWDRSLAIKGLLLGFAISFFVIFILFLWMPPTAERIVSPLLDLWFGNMTMGNPFEGASIGNLLGGIIPGQEMDDASLPILRNDDMGPVYDNPAGYDGRHVELNGMIDTMFVGSNTYRPILLDMDSNGSDYSWLDVQNATLNDGGCYYIAGTIIGVNIPEFESTNYDRPLITVDDIDEGKC